MSAFSTSSIPFIAKAIRKNPYRSYRVTVLQEQTRDLEVPIRLLHPTVITPAPWPWISVSPALVHAIFVIERLLSKPVVLASMVDQTSCISTPARPDRGKWGQRLSPSTPIIFTLAPTRPVSMGLIDRRLLKAFEFVAARTVRLQRREVVAL